MNRRPRLRAAIAASAVLVTASTLAACANSSNNSATSSTPYNVVLVADLSGLDASAGTAPAAAVQVAVGKINAEGGINGRKINLQVVDGQSSTSVALAAGQQAVSSNALAVMLFGTSAEAAALQPLLQQAKVPFLSGGIPDESVYPAQLGLYQPGVTAKQNGEGIAAFVKAKLGGNLAGKVVDIAAINAPFVDTVIKSATALLKADGATIKTTQRYNFGIASFATQAGTIAQDKPDAVLTLGAADDTIVVSKALRAAGSNALQVGMAVAAAPGELQQVADANYWALTEANYARDSAVFMAAAKAAGKQDAVVGSPFASTAWDATYILAEALRNCASGCKSGSDLNTALESLGGYVVPGNVAYGPVGFSKTSHVAGSVVKFHNYDPATSKWSVSDAIDVK